ncbi:MAG: deoxyribonuclease IV [Planctomycetota bacterium]|nr:deoxyribonuclease IV [Planctomycetota bacterium]
MSVSGGIYKALERGVESTCNVIQIFVKNQMQWKARPLTKEDVVTFKKTQEATGIRTVVAHDSYLINLASPDDALWEKSIHSFAGELERCEALGVKGLVAHPGSHVGEGEAWGLIRIANALDVVHERTPGFKVKTYLETTAGQGTNLGYKFEHLRSIIDQTSDSKRLAVCVDTCHIFAAGYDIRDQKTYTATMRELIKIVGPRRIEAFHLNDSKKDLGSRVDRHDHIGEGKIGIDAFRALMNDERFLQIPMFLETPKAGDMDRQNLNLLRSLREHR